MANEAAQQGDLTQMIGVVLNQESQASLHCGTPFDGELVVGRLLELGRIQAAEVRGEACGNVRPRRSDRVEGRKLRGEYSDRVTFLRDSYPVLSRPAMNWVDRDGRS